LASFWYRKPLPIRGEELALPSTRLSMAIVAVAPLDWGLAALLAYRSIYYFLPLIVAIGLWLARELRRK